jgi:hypothetical protein
VPRCEPHVGGPGRAACVVAWGRGDYDPDWVETQRGTPEPWKEEGVVTSAVEQYFLRDVLDIKDSVHAGEFKIELSSGFGDSARRIDEYVVTAQLKDSLRRALDLVKGCVRDGTSEAAYLHGSFGSGKSHFMTVLHAILADDPAARGKAELRDLLADNDDWLRGRRFMMVPFHLVGSVSLDSRILGGYARSAHELGLPSPPVYRSDAMLADARRQREFLGDDARFARWLGTAGPAAAAGDLPDLDAAAGGGWSGADLDLAFAAPAGDPLRGALESALLDGPLSSYRAGTRGAAEAFLPLEDGLSVMSRHAQRNGFHGLVLFLDELILWLQAHMSDQTFVNNEISKLVKLIESENTDRPVPIVSFISRQRNLSQLVGADVIGADVKNLEAQVEYLAGRFTVINLEDRNLPEIIKRRVLRPKPGMEHVVDAAFAGLDGTSAAEKDTLLDAHGATRAGWADFREVYPLSPALLNVLVALSGALQRERSGLKLLSELLVRHRDDMRVGQIIPVGELWDVLSSGIGEAFTDHLRQESETAQRLHGKVRAVLLEKYGSESDERFVGDDRMVKTLILSALAPDVPALTRLTGGRLAALNLGSVRSRMVAPGSLVADRLRELIGAGFGEIRADGSSDPVFSLNLTDLDLEPLLERVEAQDNVGARRIWLKSRLWEGLKVVDKGAFVCERELVWRGSKRTAEFVFGNVRDRSALPDAHFQPEVKGRIRFVLDYPFDEDKRYPSDDLARVEELRRGGLRADTLVWLPDHFSEARSKQFGRLLKIEYLLERDRLEDYAGHLTSDQRGRVRNQLVAQKETITSELTNVLHQLYGIGSGDPGNIDVGVPDGQHLVCLNPDLRKPRLHAGAGFDYNVLALADELFGKIYPRHPDLDTAGTRKAVTNGELKTVLSWMTRAAQDGGRRVVVDRERLALLRRIVHPLELGEVHDGPLVLSTDWQRRIEQQAAQHKVTGDFAVEDIRRWIEESGWTGLDKNVGNLIIAGYALLSDRVWVLNGSVAAGPPDLERIGAGWALRAQPMPTEQEFAAARMRAGKIFGVHVPETLFAGNVTTLAAKVKERAKRAESPVRGVQRSLERRAGTLGLAGPDAPRARSARHAADLVARMVSAQDGTPLLRELAAAAYDVGDEVLGAAVGSAETVLAALDGDWQALESLRSVTDRTDLVGEQAQRLIDRLATVADADEFTRALAPALTEARRTALTLLTRAARQDPPPAPAPPLRPVPPVPPGGAEPTSADEVRLTQGGQPPLPSRPETPPAEAKGPARVPRQALRRVRAADLTATLADLRRDVEGEAGVTWEITWRPVTLEADGEPL